MCKWECGGGGLEVAPMSGKGLRLLTPLPTQMELVRCVLGFLAWNIPVLVLRRHPVWLTSIHRNKALSWSQEECN